MATEQERNRGAGAYSTPGVDAPASNKPSPIITSSPVASFAFQNLNPPSNQYITRDDRLQMQAMTLIAAGDTLTFNVRLLRVDGVIVTNNYNLICTSAGVRFLQVQTLTEGFLLSILCVSQTATARGQTFVRASIIRVGATIQQGALGLFADYVTLNSPATWPGGRIIYPTEGPGNIRQVSGTTPGAGAEVNEVVPASTRWRLISIFVQLVTAVAVANRNVRLVLVFAGNTYFRSVSTFNQPASTTESYVGVPGLTYQTDAIATPNGTTDITLPPDIRVVTGHSIATNSVLLQAADQYSQPQYTVEEWIDLL